jgi:hypothetical protein
MTRLSKSESMEQAAARMEAAQQLLEREVAAIQSGSDWQRFLRFQARLHRFEPRNVMLIWSQHLEAFQEGRVSTPEPTYVAGHRTWQALGRQVDRGQYGYVVLAPVRYTERLASDFDGNLRALGADEHPGPGEVERSRRVMHGVQVERVFEASMTHGDPLPQPPTPRLLQGQAPVGLRKAILAHIEQQGFSVGTVPDASDLQGANGATNWVRQTVLIRADMDDAAVVKAQLHQAAHVLMHGEWPGKSHYPHARKEVEAESVAFVLAAAHGMTTDDFSFPYVATWAGLDGKDVAKEVASTQTRVTSAARILLAASPAEKVTGGRVPGVEQAIAAQQARDAARLQAEQAVERRGPGLEASW